MRRVILLLCMVFSLLPSLTDAKTCYVRDGGTATGSNGCDSAGARDWSVASNVYDQLSSAVSVAARGDEIFVANGAYSGGITFNIAASGTTRIKVCKATPSTVGSCATAHGTDTGWSNTYSAGQAVFSSSSNVFTVEMTYLTIDGVTGSGTSGHGIKLSTTGTLGNTGGTIASFGSAPNFLFLRHLELEAPAPNGNLANFNVNSQVWPGANGQVIAYCYVHGGLVGILVTGSNEIIEYSVLQNNGGQQHSEMIDAANVQNLTIRYNVLENLVSPDGTTYIEPQVNGGTVPNGIYIYGNVFKATRADEGTQNPSMFSSTSNEQVLNVFIYNNTIYGLHGQVGGFEDSGIRGDNALSTITVRNNIWQANTYAPGFQAVQVQDHNILNTGGVSFVNTATGNFHLTSATTAGVALPAPYNLDPDGNVRGADGTWDVGAYEFTGAGDTIPPAAPTGVTIARPETPANLHLTGVR